MIKTEDDNLKRKTINPARRLCPRVQVLCEKYWPLERGTVNHGLIQVTTLDRKRGPDYFVTTINLRQVRHRRIHQKPRRRIPMRPDRNGNRSQIEGSLRLFSSFRDTVQQTGSSRTTTTLPGLIGGSPWTRPLSASSPNTYGRIWKPARG